MPENVLEMAFMMGLKPKTRAGVRMFEPRNLKKMMSLAKKVEEWADQGDAPPGNMSGGTGRTHFAGGRFSTHLPRVEIVTKEGENLSKHKNPNVMEKQTTPFRTLVERNQNLQNKPIETRRPQYRHLSDAEANEKRAKGLCVRCDERFHPGHQCRRKELQVLMVSEEDAECEIEVEDERKGEEDEIQGVTEIAVLSISSVVGISSP